MRFWDRGVPALSADYADIMVHGSSALRLIQKKKKKKLSRRKITLLPFSPDLQFKF